MSPAPPERRVRWTRTHRMILKRYKSVSFFDDVADPQDWEALAIAMARTDADLLEQIGDLSLVPVHRRLAGPGAGWVMPSFTRVSPDRASRFADGSYGVYYAGDRLLTALHEHAYHLGRFLARTPDLGAGWLSEARELVGALDARLIDLRGPGCDHLLDPDPSSYPVPQAFAARARAGGANGIVYPSRRRAGGECVAALWPDVVTGPVAGDPFDYHWNGVQVNRARRLAGDGAVIPLAYAA